MARKPIKMNLRRSSKFTLLILAIMIVAAGFMLHNMNTQLENARLEQALYAQRLAHLQETNASLAEDIANSDDPALLEEIARNEFGWVSRGEKVIRFRN